MDRQARREARDQFEKRKTEAGIFQLTCAANGESWVGQSRNLGSVMNRLSFSAQTDPVLNGRFKAAWAEHGPDAFTFKIAEVIDPDTPAMFISSTLKKRLDHWRDVLGADVV